MNHDLDSPPSNGANGKRSGVGYWLHVLILGAYPLVIGLLSYDAVSGQDTPPAMLPSDTPKLLLAGALQVTEFLFLLTLALVCSRIPLSQLMLRWTSGVRPILRGFGYSILLRLVVTFLIGLMYIIVVGFSGNEGNLSERLRPRVETIVDANAMVDDPTYLFVLVSFVSFVVAGLREELWRACMLVGMSMAMPKVFAHTSGKMFILGFLAVLFGCGHLAQGPAVVYATSLLGFAFGMMILKYRSIWEAVFAHGFFDATTFVLLFIATKYFPESLATG